MTPTVEIKPLSQKKRLFVFVLALVVFVVAVPISVFYAIGYRFDFTGDITNFANITNIKSVGGMYIRNDTPNTAMFVDDEPVRDMRLFQKAAYIQNLEAGMHRIHVQGVGVQTWVKNLPVFAHFVTEASSFNLPKVPQIRIITQWSDPITNIGVLTDHATTTQFAFASSTTILEYATSSATSSLIANPEYTFVKSLFASSTQLRNLLADKAAATTKKRFTFDVATTSLIGVDATTTKVWRDTTLFEKNNKVFIAWHGDANHIPHYYCLTYVGEKKTSAQYGVDVYSSLSDEFASTTLLSSLVGQRVCRKEIQIDDLGQKVSWFDFYPNSTDIVLMQLEDGLYAVEADDRGWQNVQQLYPGKDIHVIQESGNIYINDGDYYLQVFTEIAS